MKRFFLIWSMLLSMTFVSQVNAESKIKILALGDSYTIGQSVAIEGSWPLQLVDALNSQQIKASVEIIAATGWTTLNLERAVESARFNIPYDLVTLLIGVNDQFQGKGPGSYVNNFKRLLQSSIQYVGGNAKKVVVLSIPDYAVTPFARDYNQLKISRELDEFNAINKNITQQLGAHYIDITPISREAANDRALIAGDGLHPSAKMYKRWVEKALPVVLNILRK